MPIAGINITNVNIKKTEVFAGSYQINCNANIKDVKEQELTQIKKKGLAMPLEFRVVYTSEDSKPLAEINILGDALFLDEKNEQILKEWKNERKIPEDMSLQIMNVIMRDVLTRTIQLTDFMRLPLPLPLPSFVAGPPEKKETSKSK